MAFNISRPNASLKRLQPSVLKEKLHCSGRLGAMQTRQPRGHWGPLDGASNEPQEATVTPVGQKGRVIRACKTLLQVLSYNLFEIHLKWQMKQRM